MKKATITHVSIKVRDIEKSRRFYAKLCEALGMKEVRSSESGFAYANDEFSIWVGKAKDATKHSRGIVGYDHVAFSASSRKQVDDLQKMLKKEKFRILYPAEEHPEFAPGYYSVSFFDPDGTIMELLHLHKGKGAYG
jgi:catechol 2,3-dioxygenase-like lactoylglutathione lyase family enzyme